MIRVKRIDHVAIAVPERDAALRQLLGLFDLGVSDREHVSAQKVDVAFLTPPSATSAMSTPGAQAAGAVASATSLELLASAGNEALDRFVSKRGSALHHICFEVDDLHGALATLKAAGVRLIDEQPRLGARGHDVAFIHPSATGGVLFELCAAKRESQ